MPANNSILLKNKSLLSYLTVRAASFFSDQMVAVVVGWQIYEMTKSAFYLGMVGLIEFVPMILLTLVVGYTADHFNRKIIICLCQTLAAIAYFILAAGNLYGWLNKEVIFATVFLIGLENAFQGPAIQSLLPGIVKGEAYPRALALSGGVAQAAIIGGPALGGFLYAFNPQVVYIIAGVCSILSIIFTSLFITITVSNDLKERQPVTLHSLLAGISFIKNRPIILGAISFDLFAVLFGGATALLPIYASTILMVGSFGLGLLRSAPAVGALLMSVFLAQRPLKRHVGRNMFIAVIFFGLSTIIFALSRSMVLSLLSLFILGGADVISGVVRGTLIQMETPDFMRGRVNSIGQVFINTSNQLGEFESGVTASIFGPVLAAVIGGLGTIVVVALWIRIFPQLAHVDSFPKAKLESSESF